MKRFFHVGFMVLFLVLFFSMFTYGEGEVPPSTVTVGPNFDQYKDLSGAINAVADGGTVYVTVNLNGIYNMNSTIVDKNVSIVGVKDANGRLPTIIFTDKVYPCLKLAAPEWVEIKDIILKAQDVAGEGYIIIENYTPQLTITHIETEAVTPLVLQSPSGTSDTINIDIKGSTFNSFPPKVNFDSPVSGQVSFTDNTFNISVPITNNGANISFENNTFSDSGIKVSKNSIGPVNVTNNVMIGSRFLIESYSSGDLTVSFNQFMRKGLQLLNYDSINPLNLKNNWWGSINGPLLTGEIFTVYFRGNVDYSNWALNEDCTTFLDPSIPPNEVFVNTSYSIYDSGPYVWDYEAFDNINDAMAAVVPGGTVFIEGGEYIGPVTIDKELSLSGLGDVKPTIRGSNSDPTIDINANNVVLDSIVIDGGSSAISGISASAIDSLTIKNVNIINTQSTAVNIVGVSGSILIDGCNIQGNGLVDGVYINTSASGSVDILGSSFSDLQNAIVLEEVTPSNIVTAYIGSSGAPNNFSNVSNYIYLQNYNDDVNAIDNNWNLAVIEDKLFHSYDDVNLGRVKYLPDAGISGYAHLKNSFNHQGITVELGAGGSLIKSTTTDSNGFFDFDNLAPDIYTLSFSYDNFTTATEEINLASSNVEVNVELTYSFNLMDLDEDGSITNIDLQLILNSFGYSEGDNGWNPRYDFNRNSKVDLLDLIILLRYKEG